MIMRPKNLKQAIEQDWQVYNIYFGYEKLRVDVRKVRDFGFSDSGKNLYESYWVSARYFKRAYPRIYSRFI